MATELHIILRPFLSGLILVCTAGLGGGVAAETPCVGPAYGTQATSTTKGLQNTKQLQFKILLAGEMVGEDKAHLAITNYLASDGVGVTIIHGEFPSAVAAQEYMEKVLTKAVKVSERGEKKDEAGKVVGKRAVAIVPTGKPDKPFPAILVTYGPDFYEIESLSSADSRIMELRLTSSN
jgi:hypothetical protein